jgi:hypothetical protein
MQRHVTERIFSFTKEALDKDYMLESDLIVFQTCLTLLKGKLPILEKCRLYILLLFRFKYAYLSPKSQSDRETLTEKLKTVFTEDATLKQIFIHFSLLFSISQFHGWTNNLAPLFKGQILSYFKNDGKVNEIDFLKSFETIVFTVLQIGELFSTQDFLPILLINSTPNGSFPRDTA